MLQTHAEKLNTRVIHDKKELEVKYKNIFKEALYDMVDLSKVSLSYEYYLVY